jgi:hypothetical protein
MALCRAYLLPAFVAFAVAANLVIAMLMRRPHASLVTAGACADLLISIPAVYYLMPASFGFY